jgi:hypothetical protein
VQPGGVAGVNLAADLDHRDYLVAASRRGRQGYQLEAHLPTAFLAAGPGWPVRQLIVTLVAKLSQTVRTLSARPWISVRPRPRPASRLAAESFAQRPESLTVTVTVSWLANASMPTIRSVSHVPPCIRPGSDAAYPPAARLAGREVHP